MLNRLATEEELDPYAATEEELRKILAGSDQVTIIPGGGVDISQFSKTAQAGLTQGGLEGVRPSYTKFGELGEDFQTYTPVGTTGDSWRGKTTTYDVYDPYGTATGQQAKVAESGLQAGIETFLTQAAPLLTGTPLAPFAQAYSAVKAIEAGNIAGGIASLAGLGGYADIANAARVVSAIENKDPLAALSAGMNLTGTKEIGGFNTKDLAAAGAVVQGLQSGNVAQALTGAAQLTDSPNVALAGAAVGMLDAAKSGNPAAILRAGETLAGAINEQNRYYSKTDTGDETARLMARYGTADENIIKQIEAMSPTGVSAPATTEDVEEAIFQDVLRQSPEQQIAPASTEVVQQAIQDDLNRELADIVYLNADSAGIKTQQEAAQQASQRGLPGLIFKGQTYRLSQAPGYLSPEGKLYPSEAAYVATLGPKTITIPGVQIAAPEAGAGRGIAPGATAADAAALSRIPLAGQTAAPAAPAEPFVNPAVDYTEAATGMQGTALSPDYKPTTTLADIGQNLLDVRQNINQATNTGIRTGLSQLAGTIARGAEIIGSGFGTAPESFAEPEAGMDELTSMLGTPPSSDAAVRDVQKELYDYQKEQFASLSNDAQKAAAAGIASAVNTIASYGLGGPLAAVANAAANTANISWMQGKEAGLKPEDNAKRALFMGAIEAGGEALGVPFLKMLFKEVPMTGAKEELTNWLSTKLKALGGEMFTEQLTSAGQLAVDKAASFGIPTDQTFQDAAISTGISTIFSFGGTGAAAAFTGRPGLQTVTTQAEPTPIEFLGSTPATQVVPTEGLPQQLTYTPPAPPAAPAQITGPAAAPEVFGPESQLGFEEGVRPTAQQQLEEALSGVYESPAPPAPPPSVPTDTAGITPEMVAFIDEDGGIVTYGDLGLTSPMPAPTAGPTTAQQTAAQAEPATEAIFAEPQMDEINRLFQDIYQQQNYPVTTTPTAAPAQQNVIDVAAPTVAAPTAPAQELSAIQQAINQAVYGGTGEQPTEEVAAPVNTGKYGDNSTAYYMNKEWTAEEAEKMPWGQTIRDGKFVNISDVQAAPVTGTILSTDPTQGTALVVDPQGNTRVVDVDPTSKPGDKVGLGTTPAIDPSTPVATDPVTGEVIRLGDVTPSAPSPAPVETKAEVKTEAPAQAPVPSPASSETKAEVPAEVVAPAPAPSQTLAETKAEAPVPSPAPAPTETKTEVAAPSPAPAEIKTEAPAPAEVKTEAPAPAPAETKTEAPAPAPAPTEVSAPSPAPVEAPAPAPAPTEAPAPVEAPAPATSKAPAEVAAPAPAPTEAPAPSPLPPEVPEVLPPVTEEELVKILEETPPPPPPPPAPPAPAPSPEEPAKPPAVTPPPAPTPAPPPPGDVLTPATEDEIRKIVEAGGDLPPTPPVSPEPPPPPPTLPAGDVLTPATEDELRQIVSAPTPAPPAPAPAPAPTTAPPAPAAPTPAPPAPTPAPRAPAPSPAAAPATSPVAPAAAQLAKSLGIPQEMAVQMLQESSEADLLTMFAELFEEREQKRKERGAQMKSRKA